MLFNKINPVLRFLVCVLLCFCLCCSMFILRPVEVNASPVAVAIGAISIFVSLFSILGWTLELGEDISGADLSYLANDISDGFSNFYHWLCGDYAAYYYAKNGELTQDMIDQGWYVDEVGNLLNNSYTVENPTDIVTGVDWETFEETGDITYAMQVSHYESLWQDVQNWMHGGYYRYLNQLVQSVSSEPTIAELRDTPMNLYVGPIPYITSSEWSEASYVYDASKGNAYTFNSKTESYIEHCFISSYFGKYFLTLRNPNSNYVHAYSFMFWKSKYQAWNYCSTALNESMSAEDFTAKWGISVPYAVKDEDGNTNIYCYLFSYNKDVVFRSTEFGYHEYDYSSSITYLPNTASKFIELFDKQLKSSLYTTSSPSYDDVVRASSTANQYAGTVNTGDDDGTYTPVTAPGQAGTIPVTGTGSLVNPVTGVNGSDYANGTSVPMIGTVTGSATVTQTDTGVKSEVNSVVSTATVDYPDGFDRWEPSIKLFTKFPFCVPYDLYSCFAILYKDPKELYFEIPFKISSLSLDEKVVIDLRKFDSLVLIVRYLSLIGFVVFLTLKTRDLIKG